MTVTSATATGSAAATPKSALAGLSDNMDNFLKLLTKQLTNQDPLSPLDTNEFTQQLVSFTGVEQQIAANQKLDKLISVQSGNQTATAVSFLGSEVEALSERLWLPEGSGADFAYDLEQEAGRTKLVILDGEEKPVRTEEGEREAGKHSFHWDGRDDAGNELPAGVYTVRVTATDPGGKTLKVTTTTIGRVDGVEVKDGAMLLGIGGLQLPFDTVRSVREPKAAAAEHAEAEAGLLDGLL